MSHLHNETSLRFFLLIASLRSINLTILYLEWFSPWTGPFYCRVLISADKYHYLLAFTSKCSWWFCGFLTCSFTARDLHFERMCQGWGGKTRLIFCCVESQLGRQYVFCTDLAELSFVKPARFSGVFCMERITSLCFSTDRHWVSTRRACQHGAVHRWASCAHSLTGALGFPKGCDSMVGGREPLWNGTTGISKTTAWFISSP